GDQYRSGGPVGQDRRLCADRESVRGGAGADFGVGEAAGAVGFVGGHRCPLIRLALWASHLLPRGEKGIPWLINSAHPSPLVGEGRGVRGAGQSEIAIVEAPS